MRRRLLMNWVHGDLPGNQHYITRTPTVVAASIPAQRWGQTFHRAIQNKMQWCVSTNIQEEVMRA